MLISLYISIIIIAFILFITGLYFANIQATTEQTEKKLGLVFVSLFISILFFIFAAASSFDIVQYETVSDITEINITYVNQDAIHQYTYAHSCNECSHSEDGLAYVWGGMSAIVFILTVIYGVKFSFERQ